MSKRDEPRCDHASKPVFVSNQSGTHDGTRSLASARVCRDIGCVIDAMDWVQRFTDEKAWWRVGVDGEWRDDVPAPADVDGRDQT